MKGSDRNFKASQTGRQRKTVGQRKTGENVDRRPVVAPRYESGGEAPALGRRLGTADCLCQKPARPGWSPEHRPSRVKDDDDDDDDDVYYYNRWRLKLEGETENMGVCTRETLVCIRKPAERHKRGE